MHEWTDWLLWLSSRIRAARHPSLAFDIHGLALARRSETVIDAWQSRYGIMVCPMM
jgi:hypothetical protein